MVLTILAPQEAAQPRSFRMPSRPHYLSWSWPESDTGDTSREGQEKSPEIDFVAAKEYPYIKRVSYHDLHPPHPYHWPYEARREAQQILPFLYLGPLSSARDQLFLGQEGITMILAVRSTLVPQNNLLNGRKTSDDLGLEFHSVDIDDRFSFVSSFGHGVGLINAHLAKVYDQPMRKLKERWQLIKVEDEKADPNTNGHLGKVLVYCESGIGASAAVVVAYILTMYELSVKDAVNLVQLRRGCASFAGGLSEALSSFADVVAAERSVKKARFFGLADSEGNKGSKRAFEEAEDLASGSGHNEDPCAPQGRPGAAPFGDWLDV
ncbi:MAG: hypothetical protein M1815_006095 [Lichina confinis]|nr:MAG: hypothetical protein M1815_006095 [Lichina confinis]